MQFSFVFIFFGMFFVSCTPSQPRRPINKVKNNSKMQLSIAYNKEINSKEQQQIKAYIAKDTVHSYQYSPYGFAYAVTKATTKPKQIIEDGTLVTFLQTVYNLNKQQIYATKKITGKVGASNFIKGIEQGLKLMKEDEEITFIFSSFVAHGFRGDNNKIGRNTPLVIKIKLLKINN